MSSVVRVSLESDSHDEEVVQPSAVAHIARKRTRIAKACDFCKRRKVKCDGVTPERLKCSTCISFGLECVFSSESKKRGPPKRPKADTPSDLSRSKSSSPDQPPYLLSRNIPGSFENTAVAERDGPGLLHDDDGEDDPDARWTAAAHSADQQAVTDADAHTVVSLSEFLAKLELDPLMPRQVVNDNTDVARLVKAAMRPYRDVFQQAMRARRQEFWQIRPWEIAQLTIYETAVSQQRFVFPDADLIPLLVALYFDHLNIYSPILHRPTFESALRDGLHLRDNGFGAVLLLVCALGARYTDDPRILLDRSASQSAGWQWYNQAQMIRKSPLAPPRLYDVQQYCLASQFLLGSTAPHVGWNMIGLGLRLCQDVSAHRGRVYRGVGEGQIVEEQWKRVFWILVNLDRTTCSELGRSLAMLDDDIDAPLPHECDDEYWRTPDGKYFQQPPGKPSMASHLIWNIKIRSIQAFATRTLFAVSRPKSYEWEERITARLDLALEKWKEKIPEHLRWNPSQPNAVFLRQAASLWCMYHYTRIIIHRPFIISARRATPLGISSLAICCSSARCLARILEVVMRDYPPMSLHIIAAFAAASILLLSRWGDGGPGAEPPSQEDMRDVLVFLGFIRSGERRWNLAGRLFDLLGEMITVVRRVAEKKGKSIKMSGTSLSAGLGTTNVLDMAVMAPESSGQGNQVQPIVDSMSPPPPKVTASFPPTQDRSSFGVPDYDVHFTLQQQHEQGQGQQDQAPQLYAPTLGSDVWTAFDDFLAQQNLVGADLVGAYHAPHNLPGAVQQGYDHPQPHQSASSVQAYGSAMSELGLPSFPGEAVGIQSQSFDFLMEAVAQGNEGQGQDETFASWAASLPGSDSGQAWYSDQFGSRGQSF